MFKDSLTNTNLLSEQVLISPIELKRRLPLSPEGERNVTEGRQTIKRIFDHQDHRLLVVTGPCSIHDVEAAKEYALRLKKLHDELADTLYIVMRIYFEKPRTTVGWKGLINDPYMDDSFRIEEGLHKARELLVWLAELGLPVATEALDPFNPQYLGDLFSWAAIGARTTESQTHREMASGLSMPVGFKNGTDGGLAVAINALESVAHPHSFLGINQKGEVTVIKTKGNVCGHVILRGGNSGPNYDSVNVALCEEALKKAGLPLNIMIDCSHGNSSKKPELQPLVAENVVNQVLEGNRSITGMMLESNLEFGNQPIPDDLSQLKYGVSVTDACIDWETNEKLLRSMAEKLKDVLPARIRPQAD
ncbi:3-deoxy-7-phosphoheptulonate synthase [Sedimenticola thiotaurini]|uniref:Phospho-2-dehydro-3-deoxyheptonate aldolase n=1 Tax=Sedimenticola thiotaurini TaxID=1543721 RepID=A0A0F7JVZ5_9GAMM|nr:3-deoxy-7-phosphoheptulonate synthase [Sedimenticola thiotaurini]AKH20681.1 phospho-2-dehydro-3-deoxyheptonate aldolase [Sedimenticola thiotaurini]